MSTSFSETDIYNRALTKLGSELITGTTDNVDRARVMRSIYFHARDRILRESEWNFAIKRDTLSADATPPAWGWDARYLLPADFISFIGTDDQSVGVTSTGGSGEFRSDGFRIEGEYIMSNVSNSLRIVYIFRNEDTAKYDTLFVEALASLMAYEACERITQSNTKKAELLRDFETTIRRAQKRDGLEDDAVDYPEDSWVLRHY